MCFLLFQADFQLIFFLVIHYKCVRVLECSIWAKFKQLQQRQGVLDCIIHHSLMPIVIFS